MNLKAIIIDDEKMARTLLEGLINEYCSDIKVVETCQDLATGVKAIRKLKPDLVFLDIEMPGHSGLELLEFFSEEEVDFSIIFVTAYNQYAIQAFKLSAVDYLLKPVDADDLIQSVDRYKKNNSTVNYEVLKQNLSGNSPQKIAVPSSNSIKFIEVDEILFFKAEGAYTDITLLDGKVITVSKGLKKFEDTLIDNTKFFRCHKSYIINLDHITEHVKSEGGYLMLQNKYQVSLSNDRVSELYKLMNWLVV